MKIALVHDHLISDGGGERVLKAFTEIWPDAPIYTLVFDPRKTHPYFKDKNIQTSYLQHLPLKSTKYQWFLPLRPRAVESFDLSEYDIVLSNSASLAKGIKTGPETLHINYCHTPTRFLWVDDKELLDPVEKIWPVRQISQVYKQRLKQWDLVASKRVNKYIANSENVRGRIKKYYDKDAEVIYPPVDTQSSNQDIRLAQIESPKNRRYFLIGGRITSYKKFDLVIQAFNKLGLPLKVFGQGPWLKYIKKQARQNIDFLGSVTEAEKFKLFANASAFINPQVEDFGISCVEALACGTPVIAFKAGGALETMHDKQTGMFFVDQDWQALADKVIRFKEIDYDLEYLKQHAEQFSVSRFKQKIKNFVEREWLLFKGKTFL